MPPMNDDRLDNVKRLKGQKFRWKTYEMPRPDWDHDHCAACWAKFAETESPEISHEGYAVIEEYDKGAHYEWAWASCFEDLKDQIH